MIIFFYFFFFFLLHLFISFFFFFNDTATTEIYTLSLHDALPICDLLRAFPLEVGVADREHLVDEQHVGIHVDRDRETEDRKSTRLNSSHSQISYAVFCLKKKKKKNTKVNHKNNKCNTKYKQCTMK